MLKTESRRYTHSSSFLMALFFGIMLGLGVIVSGYFGYYFARGHFIHGTEDIIETEMRLLSNLDKNLFSQALNNPPEKRIYMLMTNDSAYIDGTMTYLPEKMVVLSEGILLLKADEKRYATRFYHLNNNQKLMIGVDITDVIHDYNFMLGLSLLSIVLMLIVIGMSFFISTFVVSRTNRIAATAKNIMDTGNLSERIIIDSKWDDLSYVSNVLNSFLERTEILIDDIQRVSDNIAHDLRTPLTRLRNILESLKKNAANERDSNIIEELLAEADHLLSVFGALLRISRIETAKQKTFFAPVALEPLLKDIFDLYEPVADHKSIQLNLYSKHAVIQGDRDMLFQAFANLIDNAIKFSPVNSKIDISLDHIHEKIRCRISDQGPGIPMHEHDNVFKRFYRVDTSRNTHGSGLGLSMVAAIINLHDGHITLQDMNPGLCVTITLPPVLQ